MANSVDPDQTPRSAASDLGLHCLSMSLLWDAGINGLSHTRNVTTKVKVTVITNRVQNDLLKKSYFFLAQFKGSGC